MGKSALVRRLLRDPVLEGFTVLRAGGDTSESDLALGVVGQSLGRIPPRLMGSWDDAIISADHAVTVSSTENRPWGLPIAPTPPLPSWPPGAGSGTGPENS